MFRRQANPVRIFDAPFGSLFVVVEIKSVARLEPVHAAQLMSYLKLSGLHLGLLFNFNVRNVSREGIVRRVNGFPEE